MKKAEAISILATSARPREAKDRARYDEAVKMAIEALKCSETPKSSERTSETAQPDHTADISKKADGDTISRQAAIDALDCINGAEEVLRALPSVQQEQRWIPVTERLPENDNEVLITVWDAEDDYVEVYKGFYQGHEWWTQWCHGCSKIKDEPCGENIVIAWMPLPDPYEGGEN